ncbi:MAG: sigma-54-dependent Fis family transcriptional regulator [Abitibacteriaceae bacterium]|nr:sigma-54-dependent Fis family transcriptional regulator [Abditibacteriaceae bacterium]MBV9865037.1 sigma-54-dependent Fis family transcriptional regulator [Abditibacteriaceae bacterium]
MAHILLVDDQSSMRLTLTALLKQAGHTLMQAATGADALEKLGKNDFDVIVTDLKLDEISGIDILKTAKANNPQTEVIVLTGYGSVESAVEAMKAGAIDYLTKPVDSELLLLAVSSAMERQRLKSEVARLRSAVEQKFDSGSIVASSEPMRQVLDMVSRVAPTDATVLVQGESGTGKELIARAIHQNSKRSDAAFIPINCGALPENLLESELFGHVKGSFTGAHQNKKGLFEEADGGTLFLDEIGEMSPATQVKLLRVLQDQEVRRVGSNTSVKTDVRVIAATNQRLQERIKEGAFREDLYYRLQVILIHLPPLRERKEEILPLAEHYLGVYSQKFNKPIKGFSAEAHKALLAYSWPGNIRELINAVERAVILCRDGNVRPEDFALTLGGSLSVDNGHDSSANGDSSSASRSLQEMEREFISTALQRHNGEVSAAARDIGWTPAALSKKIKEHQLQP